MWAQGVKPVESYQTTGQIKGLKVTLMVNYNPESTKQSPRVVNRILQFKVRLRWFGPDLLKL